MTEQEAEAAVAAHYGMLLGIQSPWRVKRAKLEIAQKLVDIEVEHEPGRPVRCPQCQRECRRHDHAPERTVGPTGSGRVLLYLTISGRAYAFHQIVRRILKMAQNVTSLQFIRFLSNLQVRNSHPNTPVTI